MLFTRPILYFLWIQLSSAQLLIIEMLLCNYTFDYTFLMIAHLIHHNRGGTHHVMVAFPSTIKTFPTKIDIIYFNSICCNKLLGNSLANKTSVVLRIMRIQWGLFSWPFHVDLARYKSFTLSLTGEISASLPNWGDTGRTDTVRYSHVL